MRSNIPVSIPVTMDTCRTSLTHKSCARLPFRTFPQHWLFYLLLFVHSTLFANPTGTHALNATHTINIQNIRQGNTRSVQPVITLENGVYTLFDPHRQEHAFRKLSNGDFKAASKVSGRLSQPARGQFLWITNAGQQFHFLGSTLAPSTSENTLLSASPSAYSTQSLNPRQRPVTATNQTTHASETRKSNNAYECVPSTPEYPPEQDTETVTPTQAPTEPSTAETNPTGQVAESDEPQQTNEPQPSDEPQQCDTSTSGPHAFQPIPYQEPVTRLDARPESCESYFVEYYGTDRGFEIEAGLQQHAPYNNMQSTLRTFPVIDFMDDTTLYVVHSRDLGNRTFNSPSRPNALFKQLLADGENIQTRILDELQEQGSISASELGQSTTLEAEALRPITLQLVIRDGIASADHWKQIALARKQLMLRYGVTLEVIVIP